MVAFIVTPLLTDRRFRIQFSLEPVDTLQHALVAFEKNGQRLPSRTQRQRGFRWLLLALLCFVLAFILGFASGSTYATQDRSEYHSARTSSAARDRVGRTTRDAPAEEPLHG